MKQTIAITRKVSRRFNECEITHIDRQPIDLELAREQHRQYEEALEGLGVQVIRLPEEPDLPDAVFVEDTALVLDELAVMLRPGAKSRRGEMAAVEQALQPWREIRRLEAPATADGGDILVLGREVLVGLSTRSNAAAVEQLRMILERHGYRVRRVPVNGCLHLKSAVTQAGPGLLLVNPQWVEKQEFPGWEFIEVDPAEPGAANLLLLPGGGAVYPQHYPRTQERLQKAGVDLTLVPATEVAKAEGAVTCCSIVFRVFS